MGMRKKIDDDDEEELSSEEEASFGEGRSAIVEMRTMPRAARDDARLKLSKLMDSDDEVDQPGDFLPAKNSSQGSSYDQTSIKKKKKKASNAALLSTPISVANNLSTSPHSSNTSSKRSAADSDVIAKKKKLKMEGNPSSSASGPANNSTSTATTSEVKRISSRLGDIEWMEAEFGEERLAAVSKAIDRIFEMSLKDDNFRLFGNDMIQCFYDVGTGIIILSRKLSFWCILM